MAERFGKQSQHVNRAIKEIVASVQNWTDLFSEAYYTNIRGDRLFPFISEQHYNISIKDMFAVTELTRVVTIIDPTTREEVKRPLNEIASSNLAHRCFIGNLYKQVKNPNLVGALSGHKEGSKAFAR